jgi:hypothetical protein
MPDALPRLDHSIGHGVASVKPTARLMTPLGPSSGGDTVDTLPGQPWAIGITPPISKLCLRPCNLVDPSRHRCNNNLTLMNVLTD